MIKIIDPPSDTLKDQLKAFYRAFRGQHLDSSVVLDLSSCQFARPITLLAACACIKDYSCSIQKSVSNKVRDYFGKVHFPNGITKAEEVSISDYNAPIGYITRSDIEKREALENKFYQLIERWAGDITGISNALRYPISELVENIFEHSQKDYGWIFAQHYPKKKMLEICILDSGRGIASSYHQIKKTDVGSKNAIEMALQGKSTKLSETGRGWGLYTSKEIVNKKLRGEFLLITGNAALYSNPNEQLLIELPEFNWQGVIISYQIPYPKAPIDISDLLG